MQILEGVKICFKMLDQLTIQGSTDQRFMRVHSESGRHECMQANQSMQVYRFREPDVALIKQQRKGVYMLTPFRNGFISILFFLSNHFISHIYLSDSLPLFLTLPPSGQSQTYVFDWTSTKTYKPSSTYPEPFRTLAIFKNPNPKLD